uniref:Glycosyltransferase n=1 Tax=Aegilops tauschii TaxID=37682 RepID=M8BXV6_AEGTA
MEADPHPAVVLHACLGVGHLTPMVELAKLFLRRGIPVIIAVPTPPASTADIFASSAPAVASLAAANPTISFHHLPAPEYPNPDPDPYLQMVDTLRLTVPSLLAFLRSLPSVAALVLDTFCVDALDAADELGIPARKPEARGLLINTYERLEARAVRALREGACVPGRPTPPVYCIGPLIVKGEAAAPRAQSACLSWLDAQPERSVVFLCFGSLGAMSAAQRSEIARGLENSGHRFLWVVRSPPEDPAKYFLPRPEPDLNALLPDGFLDRTAARGMVVKMWAPQVEVLRHAATGAFVTHCGWNSVMEAASAGVPMLCWPQYAEQRANKVFVVDEMKLGVVMEGYDEELVKAEEVEKKVRLLMESDEGEKLRGRLALANKKAAEALADGGPSRTAFAEFLKDLKLQK